MCRSSYFYGNAILMLLYLYRYLDLSVMFLQLILLISTILWILKLNYCKVHVGSNERQAITQT